MNYKLKRVFAVLIILLIAFGWYVTIFGIGSAVEPTKDRIKLGLDIKGGVYVVMEAQTDDLGLSDEELSELMNQTQAVIEERVNQMGLAEPVVTVEGQNRIRVELPGAEDAEEAIEQIGRTAQLQFALADGTVVLDGGNVKDANTGIAEEGGYAVNLEFDSEGADLFGQATQTAYSGQVTSTTEGVSNNAIMIILDGQIISAPRVDKGPITGGKCEISGDFTQEEAQNLAALIRGGALPVDLVEVTSSVQTAKIGYNALEMSIIAGLIGLALVFLIMLVGYRGMGVAADLALLLYVVIILNIMAAMGSVLTLPGIAGIILGIGMAVDANVVIFSRIREEMCDGKSPRVAVQTGFKRAMTTVIDSQVTTFIAAIILYQIGTSTVKGFAWTLLISILVSLLTAVVVTRLYVSIFSESKKIRKSFFGVKEDNTTSFQIKKEIHFIKHRKIFYCISVGVMIIGLVFGLVRGLNYGIDFTGGTMLQIDMGKQVEASAVEKSLKDYDLKPEIIYSGDHNEEVVIRTMKALNAEKRTEVLQTLKGDFGFTDEDVIAQELFGPSIGKELRNNAIKAILLSALCMLIYIRFRFSEWKFGSAALLGILHDVLLVIAFYAIFHVQVNNPFIAGILTVVGYSINDTIVVFDRVRENLRHARKGGTEELIDRSITQTLGRSIMTSVTTLIVMVPLLILAGSAVRVFVLPLMVGVLVGTMSSICICSSLYFDFSRRGGGSSYMREVKRKQKQKEREKKKKAADRNKAQV